MSATLRLSGYPSSVAVSLQVAGINTTGTGTLSTAKEATPGAAAGAAPTLWGAISHGTELSPASLAVGTWQLDSATIGALGADSPYTSPQTITEASSSIWGRVNASTDTTEQTFALTAATAYPFVAMLKAGTTAKARIVMRRPSNGLESRLLANTFATVDLSTVVDAGAIDGGAVELLADGFIRMSGVFTPDASGDYTFGVGPNGEGTVELYGGAIAEISGSPPDPGSDTVPATMTLDQFYLVDAETDGETLILRVTELPADGGQALTALQFSLNSGTAQALPSIAVGDYQITVPSLALASVRMRATNSLGSGEWSEADTETPTATSAPDQGAADALTYSNSIYEGKAALDVGGGQIIAIGGTTISSSSGAESYINGIRLYNGDGSQWHCRRWGDLQYVPNGAHDDLNADEFDDVAVTWRRTGDVSDRTFTLRVYGSQMTGDDLARGVTLSTAMTLTGAPAADAILEVAVTAGGSACTPTFGGVAGAEVPANKSDVQYFRSTGSAALTFSATPANVYARVLNTPGDAATIRRMKASRSGTTLSLDWRTMPRSGFPNTAGWTEAGGTPSSPEVRNRSSGTTGFQIPTGYIEWKRFTAPSSQQQSVFVHDIHITGANSVVKVRNGSTNILLYDAEGYGPPAAASSFPSRGNFFNPLENTSGWPDAGVTRCYDTIYDGGETDFDGSENNEAVDGDAYIRNMLIRLYFMNGDWRDTGDAIADMKGWSQFHCITAGQSNRALRAWMHATFYGRTRLDGPYTQAVANLSERGGIIALWMTDALGVKLYDYTGLSLSTGTSAFGYVADQRQLVVFKAKPAFDPECDYAATDFEFEQSLDGGANWSALSVDRTGPNDCWGATRRTITGISTSITHVRARALWGAKVGAWTTAAVTT